MTLRSLMARFRLFGRLAPTLSGRRVRILIAGLPKTGTTALLHLVARSLGSRPLLLMEPKKCPADLDSKAKDVVAKILIKPGVDAISFRHFDRQITLLRDPRDRIISDLLYSQYHADYLRDDERVGVVRRVLERKESDPTAVSVLELAETMARACLDPEPVESLIARAERSLEQFDVYARTAPDALLYRYEDLVSGKYQALEDYLGLPISGPPSVPKDVERVVRTRSHGDWRDWFTGEDVSAFRPLFAPWLERHGYDAADWRLSSRPAIPAEHCSRYFLRLVEERRR